MWLEAIIMFLIILAVNVWFWGYTNREITSEDHWQ